MKVRALRPGRAATGLLAGLILTILPASVLANVPPLIDSFTAAPAVVAPGAVATLTVEAHDPDCADNCTAGCGEYIRADLTVWTPSAGTILSVNDGTSASPYTATADWEAPLVEGTYTVSVSLADSGSFMCGGRQYVDGDLDILVSVSTNEAPVVDSVTATPLKVFPGGNSDLSCQATDPDGDPVTYEWGSDTGSVTPGPEGRAVFTAGGPGIATVTCTARDPGGATGSDTVHISVSAVEAEKLLESGFVTPQRLAVDSVGDVYVADPSRRCLSVVNLFSGEAVYDLPLGGVVAVETDWADNLLVGGSEGAQVVDRRGELLLTLEGPRRDVVDVAVDAVNHRYGVLHRRSGRVNVYDELGTPVAGFGTAGDGPEQLMGANGLAATNAGGYWSTVHWLVSDAGHGQIKIYDSSGGFVSAFGDLGGGIGEFVQPADVEVTAGDVIYVSDSFQSWVQAFNPDGTPREAFGTYGDGLGEFKTTAGIAVAEDFDRMVVASLNGAQLQVFVTSDDPLVEGPQPDPQASPTALDFGTVPITRTVELTTVLANAGTSSLGIRDVGVEGGYTQSNECPPALDPGESCDLTVSFRPLVSGDADGYLIVQTSAASQPLTVALSGAGTTTPPGIGITPGPPIKPKAVMSVESGNQIFTLWNYGPGPVTILDIATSGEFTQTSDCERFVAENGFCTIAVDVAPEAGPGVVTGTLVVTSTAMGSPHTLPLEAGSPTVTYSLAVSDVAVDEGDPEAAFELVLSSPSDGSVSAAYATVSDTAVAGEDFQESAGTLTFADGETGKTITVPILSDEILEPEEELFRLELFDAVNVNLGDGTATGIIRDDELCPGPNLMRNPGAEERLAATGIPGWRVNAGVWQRVAGPPDPAEGEVFFSGGAGGVAELEQVVDVSAYGTGILAGDQRFAFRGLARTADETQPVISRMVVEYLHATSGDVLDAFDSGELASSPAWSEVADMRAAPPDTGWIRVRLLAAGPGDGDAAAHFDDLSLRSMRAPALVIADADGYEGGAGTVRDETFAVELSCPYGDEITIGYRTRNETALEDEDYAFATGQVTLTPGETTAWIPVPVYGDDEDEEHESFLVELTEVLPGETVVLNGDGQGWILNDDFDPRSALYWKNHPWLWPLVTLEIGGEQLSQVGLMALLQQKDADIMTELAREQVAVKLNLAQGSPPSIVPVMDEADGLLTTFPPGSAPGEEILDLARELRNRLWDYNNHRSVSDRDEGTERDDAR